MGLNVYILVLVLEKHAILLKRHFFVLRRLWAHCSRREKKSTAMGALLESFVSVAQGHYSSGGGDLIAFEVLPIEIHLPAA